MKISEMSASQLNWRKSMAIISASKAETSASAAKMKMAKNNMAKAVIENNSVSVKSEIMAT
jgi:hypothetical protein